METTGDNKLQDLISNIFATRRTPAAPKRVRIGLAGGGRMMDTMARAYSSQPRAETIALYCPSAEESSTDFQEFLSAVDAVEIFGAPDEERDALILSLMREGKHISINKPFAATLEQADALISEAARSGVLLRVNEPALFHSPYIKLKELMDEQEIGEICGVRIRASLCGKGGWGPQAEMLKGNFMLHPAFDCFAIAQWLAGPIESVCAYLGPMSPAKGGRAMAGLKYKAPGCYGHLDITYAPGSAIRSEGVPCDDSIEVAGSDGIMWARHFHGKMTEEPSLEIRRGKKHYTIGIGSGLDLAWDDALAASAAHFLDSVRRNKQPRLTPQGARSALKALLASRESSDSHSEVRI